MEIFESWPVGNHEVMMYTRSPKAAKIIKSLCGCLTTYENNGKIFAWQGRLSTDKLRFIERQIGEILTIENKALTGAHKAKFQFKDKNPARGIQRPHHQSMSPHTVKKAGAIHSKKGVESINDIPLVEK